MKLKNLKSSVLALFLCAAVAGCARPKIEIDASELEATPLKAAPVGLLEVHHANTGASFGIPLPESIGESAFCTATLLDDGRVLTGTDCLRNEDFQYETKNMEFHVKRPGVPGTESFGVKAILEVDHARKVAFLQVDVGTPIFAEAGSASILKEVPRGEELMKNLATLTVVVPGPDTNGRTRIKVSSTTIVTKQPLVPVPGDDTSTSTNTSTSTATSTGTSTAVNTGTGTGTTTSTSTNTNTTVENGTTEPSAEDAEATFSKPARVRLLGLKDGNWGAPVFYNGKIVGITKNGEADETNAQWILKK